MYLQDILKWHDFWYLHEIIFSKLVNFFNYILKNMNFSGLIIYMYDVSLIFFLQSICKEEFNSISEF